MNNYQNEYNLHNKWDIPDFPQGKSLECSSDFSKGGVLLFPVFQAFREIIPYYHLNVALWAANSWIQNSNLNELGIAVVFYVDNRIIDNPEIQRILQRHVPKDQIVSFEPLYSEVITRCHLSHKLTPLFDERFQSNDNVWISDSDLFVGVPIGSNKKLDMRLLLNRQHQDRIAAAFLKPAKTPRYHLWYDTNDFNAAEEIWDRYCLELVGVSHIRTLMNIGGQLYGFLPKNIDPDFVKFCRKAIPLIGDDEMLVGLWIEKTGKPIGSFKKVDLIEKTGPFNDFLEQDYPALIHTVAGYQDEKWNQVCGIDG